MTALSRYARLECTGVWRATPQAQRRDVVVNFGGATLVLADMAGRALTHWSLAAVARVNPGEAPALYTPSAEATETLEIADDTMVEAIETVRRAVLRARPRGGRVRRAILAAGVVALLGAGALWLPGLLVRHAVTVLPEASRAEIGAGMQAALQRFTRPPCRAPRADRALALVADRLAPALAGRAPRIRVVPDGVEGALALPGNTILAGRALVEDHESAGVLAGVVLAEAVRAEAAPPLADLLGRAGIPATLRLLTTGHIRPDDLARYAEARIAERPAPPPTEALLPAFAATGLSTATYAFARDITGETVLPLLEADPMRGAVQKQILRDGDWVALQNICGP